MLYEEFWVLVLFLSLQSAVILDKSLSLWASGSSLLHILQRRQRQKYVFSHTNTQKQTTQSKPFLLQMHTCVSKILVFLRQVCCYCAVAKSVRLLATPWTAARQAPLSMEFCMQEYWSGLSFPSPGDLPNPGIEPMCSTLLADSLQSEPSRKPKLWMRVYY